MLSGALPIYPGVVAASWSLRNLLCAPLNSSQEIISQSPAWLYLLSWPPQRGQPQRQKDLKGEHQLAPSQGEGLAGGMLRSGLLGPAAEACPSGRPPG